MGHATGWRRLCVQSIDPEPITALSKDDLYRAARDAASALDLRPAARALLIELVGFFREPIGGRILVWPSNETLMDRTGLSERSIRYGLRSLIEAEVITPKDSANGKRFAIRSQSGQIRDAFGFDLAPVITRWTAFKEAVARKASQKAADKRLRQEVTIIRRSVAEALLGPLCGDDLANERFRHLCERVPRQGALPADLVEAWRELHQACLHSMKETANAGKNCRLIEDNNGGIHHSCYNGQEDGEATELPALLAAVPGAMSFVGHPVRSEEDLVAAACTVRAAIGAHPSVWTEAVKTLGRLRAAIAVMVTAETYERDVAGAQKIRNPGGYLRSMVRLVADGRVQLDAEIRRLSAARRGRQRRGA